MALIFEDFAFDQERRQLLRNGQPVRLEPKAYELLDLLLERRPKALSKAQIRDVLWPGTSVSETALSGLVTDLRATLGDDAGQSRFIRTVYGFGYAFCGKAHDVGVGQAMARPAGETPREVRSPYPGLASFTEEDATRFFGREAEVEALLEKVRRRKLLAVIGPSGVGKTSFVRAGVLASRPGDWGALVVGPSDRPFAALARTLSRQVSGDDEAVAELIQGIADPALGSKGLLKAVSRWRGKHAEALLVVDQFEELFTLSPRDVQEQFATLLRAIAEEADVHVIVSMRDDFLFRCSEHEALLPVFESLMPLRPPTGDALLRAVREPALKEGYGFEDEGLVEEMVQAVVTERGALPLLAFAVSRLWEKRDRERKLLTLEAYREIGGVEGALARHAEETLERIGAQRTLLVREIFRNLVTAQGTRSVRERDELLSVFGRELAEGKGIGSRAEAEEALNALVDARLLTSYERAGEGGESHQQVEIIHESLLQAWPRLVRWQTQDADGAQLRDQLRQAAQLWHDRGETEDLLWSGQAYLDFSLWRQRYPGALSATEDAFARAMQVNATRLRRRRRAAVTALVGTAATVAIVTSVLWQRADASRRKAEAETLRAEASKLLVLAEREIERYPTAALAYALKGLELADTEVGRLLALRVLQRAPVTRLAPVSRGVALRSDFSPNGEWVALGGLTRVELLHKDGGKARLFGEYPSQGASAIVGFGPASDVLMASYRSDVRLWSVPDGRELRRVQIENSSGYISTKGGFFIETAVGTRTVIRRWSFGNGEPREIGSMEALPLAPYPAFAGGWLAYARDRKVYLRSLDNWRSPPRLLAEHAADVLGLGVSADGKRVAASDASGEVRIWPTSPGPSRPERVLRAPGTPGPLFDPSGRWLAAGGSVDGHPTVRLFDLGAPPGAEPAVLTRADADYSGEASFDPSGQWLLTSHAHDAALWWLGQTRPRVMIVPEADWRIGSLAFTPDSRWLLSVSSNGPVRAWPLSARDEPRVLLRARENVFQPVIAVHPSGQRAVVGFGGRLSLVRLDGGPPRELEGFSERTMNVSLAFGDGGRLLAAAARNPREEKVVRVFDLETGAMRTFGPLPGAGEGRAGRIFGLEFVDADRLLASVIGKGLVSLDLRSGQSRVLAAQPNGPFRLSLDRRVGVGLHDPETPDRSMSLVRFNLDGTASTPLVSYGSPTEVALDPSGTLVAAGGADGTVRIGSVAGGEPHVFLGHQSSIVAMAFSPDGRWLASTANDMTLRFWPVPDVTKPPPHKRPCEELLAVLRTHTNLRAVPDPASPTGYKLEAGPFPGWARPPEW